MNNSPVIRLGFVSSSIIYFFDEKGQTHIVNDGEKEYAAVFATNDVPYVEKCYDLIAKHSNVGQQVIVREYLGADDDGQTFVSYTALYGIK